MKPTDNIENLSIEVHQLYCAQYFQDHGKPYWTEGDYSKLDERTKEFDRNIVRWHLAKLEIRDLNRGQRVVTLLNQVLKDEQLSEAAWKRIASLNQILLDGNPSNA